jgi:hypothetical protein
MNLEKVRIVVFYDPIQKPLYIAPPTPRIFGCNPLNPSYPPNLSFSSHLQQLIGREARDKLKEALRHVLGAGALPEEDLVAVEACPSRTNNVGPL